MEGIIVAIIGVVGVGVGAFITAWFVRRKTSAEATQTEAEANEQIRATVMLLIEPLKTRIFDLECEVAALKAENDALKAWAEELVRQVRCAGLEPVSMPERKTKPVKPA